MLRHLASLSLSFAFTAPVFAAVTDWTTTFQRPEPQASTRPLDPAGNKLFVDLKNGKDGGNGSKESPFKSIAQAIKQLKPGDTLVLGGGTYYETIDLNVSGTKEAPITIRAAQGEKVILDGGFREFYENPADAWEPFPQGGPNEYRSKKPYPTLCDKRPRPRRDVYVLGNFGESMVPLHGYWNVLDLRTDSEKADMDYSMTGALGIHVGPGLWFDAHTIGKDAYGTKKIHIRLAHTNLDYLGEENNYRGETDPRKLPLVIGGPNPVIKLTDAKFIRLQDLVLRGSSDKTLLIEGGEGIECDGLTVYGGAPAVRFISTSNLKITNSAFRGVSAPWSSRYSEKYRGISTYLLEAVADSDSIKLEDKEATDSRNVEIANCEFTDCHDGLQVHAVKSMDLHHCLIERFNDDGIEPGPKKRDRNLRVYNNRVVQTYLTISLHGEREPGPKVDSLPGSGVYFFRNIFDLRAPTYIMPLRTNEKSSGYSPNCVLVADHGGPWWDNYFFYHNTVLYSQAPYRNFYASGLGGHMRGTKRAVYNNAFVSIGSMPATNFDKPEEADLKLDGNLMWSLAPDEKFTGDFFGKFRGSKTFQDSKQLHAPGWAANDVYADPKFASLSKDWKQTCNLTLQESSPAIDAGVSVPTEFPDPGRGTDKGKPDIGAIPQGSEVFYVGINGRYTAFGEMRQAAE